MMAKPMFQFRFRLSHLFVLILVAAIGIVLVDRQGFEKAVVVVELYSVTPIDSGETCRLRIVYRIESPSSLANGATDFEYYEILNEIVRKEVKVDQRIEMMYRSFSYFGREIEDPQATIFRQFFKDPISEAGHKELEIVMRLAGGGSNADVGERGLRFLDEVR